MIAVFRRGTGLPSNRIFHREIKTFRGGRGIKPYQSFASRPVSMHAPFRALVVPKAGIPQTRIFYCNIPCGDDKKIPNVLIVADKYGIGLRRKPRRKADFTKNGWYRAVGVCFILRSVNRPNLLGCFAIAVICRQLWCAYGAQSVHKKHSAEKNKASCDSTGHGSKVQSWKTPTKDGRNAAYTTNHKSCSGSDCKNRDRKNRSHRVFTAATATATSKWSGNRNVVTHTKIRCRPELTVNRASVYKNPRHPDNANWCVCFTACQTQPFKDIHAA